MTDTALSQTGRGIGQDSSQGTGKHKTVAAAARLTPAELHDPRWAELEEVVRASFSKNDFHRVEMRGLARNAGMSFATIYRYFGSKEGLLFSFVAKWQDDLALRIGDQVEGLEDGREIMRKLFWVVLDYYGRNRDIGGIFFLTLPMKTWMADDTFQQRELTRAMYAAIDKARDASADGGGALAAASANYQIMDAILGLIHRAFTMWIFRGAESDLADETNLLFKQFWTGAGGE